MNDRISTKAGIFESGEKDAYGVQYKDGRLIACRNNKLEDYTVADGTKVICDRAFMNLKDLKSIILPESLKAIGESAFSGCKALADIDIPEGVTGIRQATFRDCDSLSAIELPASVSEIDKFAFGRGLTTLVLNAPEVKIDRYAFMNARDLSTLIVPAGSAEYYRSMLADMRVMASVEEMEDKTEEPASLLGTFLDDHEDVTEGTINILGPNDIEEKKNMKTVTVEVFGEELFLEPKDPDEEEEDDWEGWDDDDDLLDDDEDEGKTIEKKSSILKLSGKGVIIEGFGENGHYRGVFKSDFKVTLNGEDITDRVTYWEAASAFLVNSLINEDVGDGAYMVFNISTEIDLPESVFILPENADIESIELIPVCKDFREPYDEGIVADFIIYDGNVREADSFNNENGLLSKIVYKGQDYDCNQDIYMDYNDPEIELKLYPW